ncbi:uncharacterized mitochondrial protein-like protein, partial [Tanacetum coccineum]
KNKEMNQFCERKGIKREFSVARIPQQNGVATRKNRTLIEAARSMLANSKLPTTFWAGQLLAERLQAREQEELTIEEMDKFFQQLLEKRRKHFAAKRAEEKRNIPPTKAQQRSIMCTYLKNMEGWKPKDLKNKSFNSIQNLFDKAMKTLEQESIKKQKVDEDKDIVELNSLMEVLPDEDEVAVDAIPLATKPPSIVDWKIHKEGNKSYY